jgi:hypothetical protein
MPRTSVWFNDQQLAEVHDTFGEAVNLSGVVRVALGSLLDKAGGRHGRDLKTVVHLQSDLADAMDDCERIIGRAGRAKAEREAKP